MTTTQIPEIPTNSVVEWYAPRRFNGCNVNDPIERNVGRVIGTTSRYCYEAKTHVDFVIVQPANGFDAYSTVSFSPTEAAAKLTVIAAQAEAGWAKL